ncbi:hypothetical protein BAUCODRAFT_37852 [Baudoinia panamericana UAMH 10762]|uniref:Hypervirulence associated protein TUDOR domain-containing protein n=1 Tax=Baudoinia panamericana (strain UAMH 10762) TaxID=717646 RepID=M2N2Q6_BAUPA|nr:uncharacterized protein BAUCODRAFT_37852 [Baudoinia panamericana UAMH 10762]EMC92945.1 hypothetical protein BAUCODRAFT_37852 [Baudoinia panamericana UAMH 10762]
MPEEIKEGDQVSWQWSGGRPGGEAAEVKEQGEMKITTKKGNEVKKNADPENPAVKIKRSGQDVVKKASELDVEESSGKKDGGDGKTDEKDEPNGEKEDEEKEAQAGDKRKADDKEAEEPKENGEKAPPKKKGRPAKKEANGDKAPKAKAEPKKKREPKKAATESGEPRRSGRHASK